jgi:GTP cyclohydrolase I
MENEVGQKVHLHLEALGIESPAYKTIDPRSVNQELKIGLKFREILLLLGLDLDDDSLRGTPSRIARMYCDEIFWGLNYKNFPRMTVIENKMKYDEMVAVTCVVRSMCEHHFVPFIGTAYVGYIPKTKVLGLSKFNRVVDFFSRRPQVQERLTAQVAATLELILETDDIAVVIKAKHMCVALRGVKDESSETVTSKMGGRFFKNPALRSEFLALSR